MLATEFGHPGGVTDLLRLLYRGSPLRAPTPGYRLSPLGGGFPRLKFARSDGRRAQQCGMVIHNHTERMAATRSDWALDNTENLPKGDKATTCRK
jgi:hypothetical protein